MLLFLLTACATDPSPAAAAAALMRTEPEPDGENCADGGVAVHSGRDDDGDGILSDAEIQNTDYVCDGTGADGASGADGADGTDGGTTLVAMTDEPAGDNCPSGGTRVNAGVDDDADGVLDPEEIDVTEYVCDGDDGAPGVQTLVAVTEEPAGENCPYGGQRLDTGADTDGSGVLDAGEVTTTAYVCTGTAGAAGSAGSAGTDALVTTADEPAGLNCAAGGVAVSIGTDDNDDGALGADEIDSTVYVCDGESGSGGIAGTIVAGDYTVANSLDAALLDGVEQITGTLTIYGVAIGDVEIPDLVEVGGLVVGGGSGLFGLSSLSLPALTAVDNDVYVGDVSMTDWSGLDSLTTVGGQLSMYSPNSSSGRVAPFRSLTSVGTRVYVVMSGTAELGGFDSLVSVGTSLMVSAGADFSSLTAFRALVAAPDVTISTPYAVDLSGLGALAVTTGVLSISAATTDLDDFSSLRSPAGITLVSMSALTDIGALSSVTALPSGLSLYSVGLSDLTALSGLRSASSLTISGAPALTSLDGLEGLDIAENGTIFIGNTEILADISALSGTTGTLRSLSIDTNPVLTNLDGLDGVTYVGSTTSTSDSGVYIYSNVLLTDIDGLFGIMAVGYGSHYIYNNTSLCTSRVTAWQTSVGAADFRAPLYAGGQRGC